MYRLRCFGGATVLDTDGREIHFRSRKHLALLLYLAAHTERPLTRERLVGLLWETEESLARHSLSQGLYDLRKRLGSFDLLARAGTVRIRGDGIDYEAVRFEEALQSDDLETAVGLFRGEFAPNLQSLGTRRFERWLEGERTRFRTLGQMALRRYAGRCDEQGDWAEMCLAALRLVKLDPLDERGHRALMRALWLQGDRHSALQHYDEVRHRLERELPAGLSRETRELAERIRSTRTPVQIAVEPSPGDALPMVGREEEFRILRGAVKGLTEGHGALVLVQGEAGIGKTRLMEETVRFATVEGLGCLESRCYPAESDVAYGPVLDGVQPVARRIAAEGIRADRCYYQLGHLFPELFGEVADEAFETIDPAVRRRRLFEEVTDLLRRACRSRGVVWIVEDIQWIDSASASLLHYIHRRLKEEPFVLVLTGRTEERRREPVTRLVTDSSDSGTLHIDLGPLSGEVIRDLLESASAGMRSRAAVDLAARYSGGNPFYALEILQAASSARNEVELASAATLINARLRNLLALRLRGLSARALRLLEAVAVLERHATPENVLAVTGLRLDEAAAIAAELRGRRLLNDTGDRLEFPHDITREYIYSNLGNLQRAALHLTVGEVLSDRSDVSPATLARHFEAGGDRPRAYEFAMRAATSSAASSAHDEAARMATLAADVATTGEAKLAALQLLATSQVAAGRFRRALDTIHTVLTAYPELSASAKRRLYLQSAEAAAELCDWSLAKSHINRVHQHLSSANLESGAVGDLVRALSLTIKLSISGNDATRADEAAHELTRLCNEGVLESRATNSMRVEAACALAAHASFLVSTDLALTLLEDSAHLAAEAQDTSRQQYLTTKGLVLLRQANWTAARRTLNQALKLATRLNDVVRIGHIKNNLACLELEQGQWLEAEALCRSSRQIYAELMTGNLSALQPLVNHANVHFYQAQFGNALSLYKQARRICLEESVSPSESPILEINASLGLVALATDRRAEARVYWEKAKPYLDTDFLGLQERFKVEWFRAAMHRLDCTQPDRIAGRLTRVAHMEADKDTSQALKLQWLAQLFTDSDDSGSEDLRTRLRDHGLIWFVFLTRRWSRRAYSQR